MTKKKKIKKFYMWLAGICGTVLIVFLSLAIWLVNGGLTKAKTSVLTIVPFPIVLVNGSPIMAKDFLFRYDLRKQYSQEVVTPKGVLADLVYEKKLEQLAARHNVFVSKNQLQNEFNYRLVREDPSLAWQSLRESGLNEVGFKSTILKPSLLLTNFQTWFYSRQDLNSQAYTKALSIKDSAEQGIDFGNLAKNNTQDEWGALVEGDMGFIEISSLLSEIQEGVDSMQVSEVKIIPSRFGLHVVKLEAKDNSGPDGAARLHLKQIFVFNATFTSWAQEEIKNIVARQLIKI